MIGSEGGDHKGKKQTEGTNFILTRKCTQLRFWYGAEQHLTHLAVGKVNNILTILISNLEQIEKMGSSKKSWKKNSQE